MKRSIEKPKITPVDIEKGTFKLSHVDDGIATILKQIRKQKNLTNSQ